MKNKRVWLVIAAITVVILGAIVYAVGNKDRMPSYSQQNTFTNTNTTPNNKASSTSDTTSGKYVDYSADAFAQAEGRRWLFFHAGWCPQCRALEKNIQESGVPDGVTIFKVDYDSETSLKKKYGVTLQTTIVETDENGNEIKKFVAYDNPTVGAVVNALGQ